MTHPKRRWAPVRRARRLSVNAPTVRPENPRARHRDLPEFVRAELAERRGSRVAPGRARAELAARRDKAPPAEARAQRELEALGVRVEPREWAERRARRDLGEPVVRLEPEVAQAQVEWAV